MDDRCRVASIMLVQASISSLFRKKKQRLSFNFIIYMRKIYMDVNERESCGRKLGRCNFFLSKNCTFLRDFEV